MVSAKTVTILFTDLVGSTELLQRAGDEQAQRIFKAHHRLLREAVEAHGGHEVKWLGDGLMVAFDSAAEAVKCAIAMQQASKRPAAGERLEIRAGLNVGEAFVDESDYFGTSVVIARRLCDSGGAGEIRASDIVVRLLDGRGADITTNDLGPLELKGITNAVPAVEIVYQHDPMALLRKLPFVGRQAEYETMLKKLAEARNGRGSVVLLAGEPGIGKTRLTEEFCEHASSGATVIRGNCYEGDVAAPFGPWTEALRSLIDQTPDANLRETLGPGAPDIAPIIPEIRRRIPDLEESPKLEPESERARLFESIGAWLRNAADAKPLVIFLDDLHWCDRPSLALLEQVARGVAAKRIVIVGTYRDVEVDRVHPLAQTLASLRRMEHHERIAVRGFTQESVYELLHAIEPSDQAEAAKRGLAQVLFTESEGNPFFLREVLNNLVETGKLAQQDGVWTGTVASIEELGIPEGIKEIVGRRLSRMSETCNRMLGRASAMTGGFTWDELRSICEEPEDDLLDALDEALGSQLIAERERNAYAFTHALIRATLYDELSTPRRVQLHRRIAESLESLYAGSIDEHLGELAAHYMASTGNAAEKAVEYSVRAGDRATELFAWEEAIEHYQHALEAMEILTAHDDEARCGVLLKLGECQRILLRPEAIQTFRSGAGLARNIGSAELFAEAAVKFDMMAYHLDEDLSEELLSLLDEALGMLGNAETFQRARTLAQRLRAAVTVASARSGGAVSGFSASAGRKDPGLLAQAREALSLAERVGDDEAIWGAANVVHDYSWGPDNAQERLELCELLCRAALNTGSATLLGAALAVSMNPALELGNIEGLRSTAKELAEHAERTGTGHMGPAVVRIALEAAQGELALADVHRSELVSRYPGTADLAAAAVAQLAAIRILQGRFPELEQTLSAIVESLPAVPVYAAALALLYAMAGKPTEAVNIIDRLAANGAADVPRDPFWKACLYLLADACGEIEHRPAAQSLYDTLMPYASHNATVVWTIAFGSMARVVGRLATLLERWDEAEQHFEEALASNEQQGFHAWTAWTRLNYGDMLLRRASTSSAQAGDRERAHELLSDALAFAKGAGMGKVERDAEALLGGAAASP